MQQPEMVKVWDPLVRLFHWTLVIGFAIAYLTEDDLLDLHVLAGYTVLGLVLFRILWGFVGPRHARFRDFVYPFATIKQYTLDTLARRGKRYLGHNPAGGAMILLLLVCLLLTCFTGLAIYGIEEKAGPLAGLLAGAGEFQENVVEEIHEFLANFTLLLVFIHVGGVIYESLLHRESLVKAMINGYKRAGD